MSGSEPTPTPKPVTVAVAQKEIKSVTSSGSSSVKSSDSKAIARKHKGKAVKITALEDGDAQMTMVSPPPVSSANTPAAIAISASDSLPLVVDDSMVNLLDGSLPGVSNLNLYESLASIEGGNSLPFVVDAGVPNLLEGQSARRLRPSLAHTGASFFPRRISPGNLKYATLAPK
ncbi:hypothetical protein BCR35DRAFT_178393 [Leucosporidium creatinivorum]|uniref:Uncharacterized protein n=1 Tax=Leucosporidium creatinivorum TaxID=106004 RepID=A0A1Y2E922_9BASI|nr:hypothetical protein BCR35DRAFT_178393 [Leucosporidium creatinivorum]